MVRLTVKERILLHLFEFTKFADALDVPPAITQTGIATAASIQPSHVTQYVRPMIRGGWVLERMAHIERSVRRRKVYQLTPEGRMEAARIREAVRSEIVPVRDASGVRQASIAEVMREAGAGASFSEILRQVTESGTVDLAVLTAKPQTATGPIFVERLSDAPKLVRFVGRRAELERLTGKPNGMRVSEIRGIAGIGKSCLAAKACELRRGSGNLFWHRVRPWDTRQSILAKLAEFLAAAGRPGLRAVLSRGGAPDVDNVVKQELPKIRALLVLDDAHVASAQVLALLAFLKDVIAEASDLEMIVLTRRSLPFYDRRDVLLTGLVGEMDLEGLGAEDITALIGDEGRPSSLVQLGEQLGGHPLSLELLRSATPSAPEAALRDIQRFIEEEVYRELEKDERSVMKVASLYQVPLPREVLLSIPSASHDSLLSLQRRALLRRVGDDSYEIHDTIRDFFAQILTPAERELFSAFAAEQLQHLALKAQRDGDLISCINCLANARELLPPGMDDPDLLELLGDSYDRIGDLPAAMNAFRGALRSTRTAEARARIHRKMASALEDRGDIAQASAEVEEGLKTCGEAVTAERGWLDLIRCRVAYRLADWEQARDAGESALETFQILNVPAGRARTLLILGHIAMHSPQDDPSLAERHLTEALGLAKLVDDFAFAAETRIALAHLLAWHLRDLQGALRHAAAIEDLETGADLPQVRRKFRLLKGMIRLIFFADYEAAEASFRSALDDARKVYDTATVANAKVGLGYVAYLAGRFAEARRLYEDASTDQKAQGLLVDTVSNLLGVSEAYFLEGNQPASAQVFMSLMSDPSLARAVGARSFYIRLSEAYLFMLQGDREEAYAAFHDVISRATAKSGIGEGTLVYDFVACISWPAVIALLYSGVALRFLGRGDEGDEQIKKAREIAESYAAKAWLEAIPRIERRITEVLEGLLGEERRSL